MCVHVFLNVCVLPFKSIQEVMHYGTQSSKASTVIKSFSHARHVPKNKYHIFDGFSLNQIDDQHSDMYF